MVHVRSARGLPPLRRTKLSKKAQERQDEIKKNIYEANNWWGDWKFQLHGTSLSGLILNLTSKELNPFMFLQKVLH